MNDLYFTCYWHIDHLTRADFFFFLFLVGRDQGRTVERIQHIVHLFKKKSYPIVFHVVSYFHDAGVVLDVECGLMIHSSESQMNPWHFGTKD